VTALEESHQVGGRGDELSVATVHLLLSLSKAQTRGTIVGGSETFGEVAIGA